MRKIIFSEFGVLGFLIAVIFFLFFKGDMGIDTEIIALLGAATLILILLVINNRRKRKKLQEKFDRIEEMKEFIKNDTDNNFSDKDDFILKDKYYF
jgi:Na+/H+ antiporter NhaD/arsenite permease-like protein